MATHSSILAWRIPRTEKHGGLNSGCPQEALVTIMWTLLGGFLKVFTKQQLAFSSPSGPRGSRAKATVAILILPQKSQASLIAQLVKNPPAMQETPVQVLGQEDPLEKGQATHSSILGLSWWLSWLRICLQNVGDLGSVPGLGRNPGEGNGHPLQYSRLENPMDGRSLVGYSPWRRKESDMTERLYFTHQKI